MRKPKSAHNHFMQEPHLSIVIPAYNEEERLPPTLRRLFSYLPSLGRPYEIVIVDDGSRDRTVEVVRAMQKGHPELRLISDGINRGRGEAVRIGIREARGTLVLETDSDGSVADEAIGRFVQALDKDPELDAVFGSRELPDSHIAVLQPPMRVFLGWGFIYLGRLLFWIWGATDFTLGFKMFRAAVARDVVAHQYDPYFLAEGELYCVTHWRGYSYRELPVTWTDNKDSRVRPLRDVPRSLAGMGRMLVRRIRGAYR